MLTGEAGDIALGVACNPTQRALQEGKVWEAYALRFEQARFAGWTGRELIERMHPGDHLVSATGRDAAAVARLSLGP